MYGRFSMFGIISVVIYFAKEFNGYAAEHYDSWGITQDYFDTNGVFMACMVCSPLMVIFMGMMLHLFFEIKDLMVQLKVMQIKQKQQQHRKKNKKD
jgi:hypothetical protein